MNSALGAILIGIAIMVQAAKKVIEEKLPEDHPVRTKHLAFCFK